MTHETRTGVLCSPSWKRLGVAVNRNVGRESVLARLDPEPACRTRRSCDKQKQRRLSRPGSRNRCLWAGRTGRQKLRDPMGRFRRECLGVSLGLVLSAKWTENDGVFSYAITLLRAECLQSGCLPETRVALVRPKSPHQAPLPLNAARQTMRLP